jgi:acyl carrier protein
MSDALARLTAVFVDTLGISVAEVPSSAYRVTPGWDSVAHMTLVAGIEQTFDVMLETDDVIGLSSFEKAREVVRRMTGEPL